MCTPSHHGYLRSRLEGNSDSILAIPGEVSKRGIWRRVATHHTLRSGTEVAGVGKLFTGGVEPSSHDGEHLGGKLCNSLGAHRRIDRNGECV